MNSSPFKFLRIGIAILLLGTSFNLIFGQELITDRPDFTESGVTVPFQSVQAEFGATYETFASTDIIGGPELLIRYSPFHRIEFRFELPDYTVINTDGEFQGGAAGFKWQLGPAARWDLALIGMLGMPVTETENEFSQNFIFAAGRDLNDRWSFGSQIAATWEPSREKPLLEGTMVAGTGISNNVGAFFEIMLSDWTANTPPLLLHHGYTIIVHPTLQLDVHAGAGLNKTAPDFFLGCGASIRFD
ncbi:MAG: hypothetical protein GF372_00155 [Candidatus Marinimicrobia bacterium]|nr:hypothetical protein [Candidatus Neomarinimicrobiota bacterium]